MNSPKGRLKKRKRATNDSSIANYRRFFFDGLGYAPEIKFENEEKEEWRMEWQKDEVGTGLEALKLSQGAERGDIWSDTVDCLCRRSGTEEKLF